MIILILLLLFVYISSILACRREMIIDSKQYSFDTLNNGSMILCFIPLLNTFYFIFEIMERTKSKLAKKFFGE